MMDKTEEQPKPNKIDPIVLEAAIVEVADALRRLNASRLNRKAVVVLLRDVTGLGKGTVESVLDGIEGLESRYLKPRKA